MSKPALGRLEKLDDLRSYWEREDTHFTPWLAGDENITLLGDTIGIELEVQEQEANVGPFRADILCRNTADNSLVLIENQLERTDHGHLGQLLTYAAGLDAVTLVWVVEKFTEEHRAALDWLNRITDDSFHFFGLEIELWRIGDSVAAPKFNIVAKPNDWSKTVKEAAESHRELSSGQQLRVEYWGSFGEFIVQKKAAFKPPKPYPSNWMGYGVGRTGAHLLVVLNQNEAFITLETDNRNHPGWFHMLREDQENIERELGFALEWNERPSQQYASMRVSQNIDALSREEWPAIHDWMLEKMTAMREVFRPRVKALDDSGWQPDPK